MTIQTDRRVFLKKASGLAFFLPWILNLKTAAQENEYPKLVFRMGWNLKDNNDIALIPALYRICQATVQKTEFYLWLSKKDQQIIDMMNSTFTDLKLITGEINELNQPTNEELRSVLHEADLLLYAKTNSNTIDWANRGSDGTESRSLIYCVSNNIPVAIAGINNIPGEDPGRTEFLDVARNSEFLFITSSSFEKNFKDLDIKIPNLRVIPNPLFAFDLRSDFEARKILEDNQLINNDFLTMDFSTKGLNEEKIKAYGGKIRAIITQWIEETGNRVLILPNNEDEIDTTEREIYEPLDSSVKNKIVFLREKLMPDVAASIYEKSRIVSGMSLFPACSAIRSGNPVFFLTTINVAAHAEAIEETGLKKSVWGLEENSAVDLSKALIEMNDKYVSNILESDKAREYAAKKFLDHFGDVNKFISKRFNDKLKDEKKKKK